MAGLGDPVSGAYFFNRKTELELLTRRVDSFLTENERRNIALIGLRKIGKSCILEELIKRNSGKKCLFIPIYLPESGLEDFTQRVVGSIVINALTKNNEKIDAGLTIQQVIIRLTKYYPETAAWLTTVILNTLENGKVVSLKTILSAFDVFQKESKLALIVILDEFQRLTEYDLKAPTFREFIMKQNEILFIVSGSSVGMLNQIIQSSESPLFGHIERVPIGPFNFESSVELVNKKLNLYSINQTEIGFLYELTNGNPYYLDILTFRIKDLMKENRITAISNELFIRAITFEMFTAGGAIYSHLSALLEVSLEKRGFGTYIEILKAIANGNSRVSDISKESGVELTSLPRYMKRLVELELIARDEIPGERGAEYHFVDNLLELWLKEVYMLRENPLMSGLETKKKQFEERISKILSEYKREIGTGNEARVRELFRLLDGRDKIHGKSIPRFEKVDSFDDGKCEIDILAKINDKIWVGEVSDSKVSMAEINHFEKKLEESKISYTDKFYVALQGIDDKCLKYCKENEILVLTKEGTNELLKKYKKRRILL